MQTRLLPKTHTLIRSHESMSKIDDIVAIDRERTVIADLLPLPPDVRVRIRRFNEEEQLVSDSKRLPINPQAR